MAASAVHSQHNSCANRRTRMRNHVAQNRSALQQPCALHLDRGNRQALPATSAATCPRGTALKASSDTVPVEESYDQFEESTSALASDVGIEEVFYYNFHEKVQNEPNKLVVLDFYTDKCGPCKLIYPKVCELADEYNGEVAFYRLNCNRYNKPLAKELDIKSVPTFKLFLNGQCVDTMTGARIDELREMIESHRNTA